MGVEFRRNCLSSLGPLAARPILRRTGGKPCAARKLQPGIGPNGMVAKNLMGRVEDVWAPLPAETVYRLPG